MSLRILLISLLALSLSIYGASVASTLLRVTPRAPAPIPHPSCTTQAELVARRDALLGQGRVVSYDLSRMRDAPESWAQPGGEKALMALIDSTASGDRLLLLHCAEYPCVALLKGPPPEGLLEGLGHGGYQPIIEAAAGLTAVALPTEDHPAPARTAPRMKALLAILAP